MMLMIVKCMDRLRMGGPVPSDLLLSPARMEELHIDPTCFVFALPLAPGYNFSVEEMTKLEGLIRCPKDVVFNRHIKGALIIWTAEESKEAAWTGKALEAITVASNPYIMGGLGSFWPLPLQRQGICTTVMWEVTLPENPSTSWMDYLSRAITEEWKGLFWTLSKK